LFSDHTEPLKAYDEYDSRHPYYWVRNLLNSGVIDVIVEFCEVGPSGSMWAEVPEETAKRLSRIENASLWEIEPPTELARQKYELRERIGKAETDDEFHALVAQLKALNKQKEPESVAETDAPAQPGDQPMPFTVHEWLDRYATEQGITMDELMQAALEAYARQHGYVPDRRKDAEQVPDQARPARRRAGK
jgi:hypothetical protein